ncbi:MAG: zinc-ribbon domain-containing protein [Firmicutes bacterium]|nr:zinc-ribbon domain-containing protein [Bacillota bacterium]
MYCRNCGNKIVEGDKFCSECGTKVAVDTAAAPVTPAAPEVELPKTEAVADDAPLFEPFDFKAFGFDFSELGLGTGLKEETKPTPPTETFDWNTGEFPDRNTATKTEDINFNWSLSPDEPAAPAAEPPKAEPVAEVPAAPEMELPKVEPVKEETPSNDLFGDLEETRKQSEEIDKFFTFHRKNEEFQKILDREYEKVRSGNIIAEELSAAEAGAEDMFTARQPEDPMEELFASEGVVRGYEPKPIETDVLERIEAADEEKRVREEAARLVEEERARREAEEAAAAAAAAEAAAAEVSAAEPVEEPAAEVPAEEPVAETPAEESATDDFDLFAQLEAMDDAAEEPAEDAVEIPVEEPAVVTVTDEPAAEVPAEEPAAPVFETPVTEEPAEEPAGEIPASETAAEVKEEPSEEAPAFEIPAEPAEEEVPEKTKTVDKAAILAGMAIANEMVERDRAIAAEQAAAETTAAAAVIEDTNVDLPDFLGHEEDLPAVQDVAPESEEEPETADEDVEFEIFEQLENAEKGPEEEIVLTDSQTLVDLFADAETVENHEKGWTEHTLILSEDSVAEILNASGEEDVTENTVLFSAETLGAILAEAEQENPEGSEVVVSVESLTEVPEAAETAAGVSEEAEEEPHGKGRTVLKVLLVILIILLVLEIAGVAIKLLAPTSNAANFIDNQLTKVFQLISGEDDKELNVFAEAEEIRTEPLEDKTELIAAEKSKNKNGNIASVVYNQDLAFDSGKKYENTDLNLTQDLTDVAWYKNADNRQVYYDQAIVGTMIAYDSQRVNLVNSNDPTVLNLMVEGTELYNEVSASAGKGGMTFELLQLGEIRQSGSSYFIWTAETIGGETESYIYEMQPAGETMKIKARHEA